MGMRRPLGLAVAMGIVLDITGAMHVYGLADAKGQTRELISAFLLLGIAVLWLLPSSEPAVSTGDGSGWLAFLPPLVAAISISDVLSFISAGWTSARFLVLGGGIITLVALALWRRHHTAGVVLAMGLGVAIRAIHIRHVPLEPARGDMLPLVQSALANLVQGNSPYTTYHMPWELPLTYLPLTWLAYAPAYLARIDLRWTNILAEFAVLAAALFVALGTDERRRPVIIRTAGLYWATLFLSPTVIHWDMVTSAPIGWVALAWSLALVVTSRHRAASVVLGVAAATTPLVAVLAPLVVVCWWRASGTWSALRHGVRAAFVAAILLLPWLIWAPGPFIEGNVSWFNDLNRFPRVKWQTEQTWEQITGFSGWFWSRGREGWLKPIQAGLLALVTLLYALRGAQLGHLQRYTAAAFLLFVLFNPVLWPYLYHPALLAALLAVAADGAKQTVGTASWSVIQHPARQTRNVPEARGVAKSYEL